MGGWAIAGIIAYLGVGAFLLGATTSPNEQVTLKGLAIMLFAWPFVLIAALGHGIACWLNPRS